jgi:uncharacterized protein YbcI
MAESERRPVDQTEFEERASVLASVSNAMVRLYKEMFGRGPTKARSYFAGPDVLVCILGETFTPAERNLVTMGEQQRLRDARVFFQHASETQFRETVEGILGRKVTAFVSGVDVHADLAAEVFVLEPAAGRPVSPPATEA